MIHLAACDRRSVSAAVASASFYEDALHKIIHLFSSVEGIDAIYRFGGIKAPGNSDIDLMIVIRPSEQVYRRIRCIFETKLTPDERFILYQHDPLVLSSALAKRVHWIRPTSGLQHVSGAWLRFQCVDNPFVKLYQLIELMTQYYPIVFLVASRPARLRFQHLNALAFTFSIFQECACEFGFESESETLSPSAKAIFRDNDNLRAEHGRDPYISFERRLGRAESAALLLISSMQTILDSHVGDVHGATPMSPRVIRDRLFCEDFASEAVTRIGFCGIQLRYWRYPSSYYPFFGGGIRGDLRDAVRARNDVLVDYRRFIHRYVDGRSLYEPWWMHGSVGHRLVYWLGAPFAQRDRKANP